MLRILRNLVAVADGWRFPPPIALEEWLTVRHF